MTPTSAPCDYWDGDHHCGDPNTRRYLPGDRCPRHTPAALAGRAEPYVDPALTLEALRRRKAERS